MIFTVEKIGKSILKQNDTIEFKKQFNELYYSKPLDNILFHEFLNSTTYDGNQFESLIVASTVFFKESPEDFKPILNRVMPHSTHLALKINFILWVLNNYKHEDKILNLINLPYRDIFGNFDPQCYLDDAKLKKVFEEFFSKDDELFNLILKLRNDFQNSKIFKRYVKLSSSDEKESEYYKKAIKSHFYIIKELIFEMILFDDIPIYDENNILNFSQSQSAEGNWFDIKMINAIIKDRYIIKIDLEDNLKYALISSKNIKVSQKKGTVIRIKGEFINNGFGKYSKNMDFCSEKIDRLNEFNIPQTQMYFLDP